MINSKQILIEFQRNIVVKEVMRLLEEYQDTEPTHKF